MSDPDVGEAGLEFHIGVVDLELELSGRRGIVGQTGLDSEGAEVPGPSGKLQDIVEPEPRLLHDVVGGQGVIDGLFFGRRIPGDSLKLEVKQMALGPDAPDAARSVKPRTRPAIA